MDENQFEWRLAVEEDATAEKQAIKNRHTEEVEAESISYAVCKYYGIETGENSFGYIASWSQGKELKELRASLETINKTSGTLISDIERHYKHNIITMDRCIDKSLCHSSFSIIRLVYTILCLFDKTDFGIIANKFTAAFQ